MKKRFWCAALLAVIGFRLSAQEVDDKQVGDFWSRLFLSSVDVGYQVQNADLISNSVRIGTSIEYRQRFLHPDELRHLWISVCFV